MEESGKGCCRTAEGSDCPCCRVVEEMELKVLELDA